MSKVRPPFNQSAKDRAVGEVIKDATAPLQVNDKLSKLARMYGTERVLAAVKEWVAYIESVKR